MQAKPTLMAIMISSAASIAVGQANDSESDDTFFMLEEIIVTAQKREQDVISVPLSVSVANAETLIASNSTNLSDLTTLAPNVAFSFPQSLLAGEFSIRGVASSANSPGVSSAIAVAVDEVFLARPGSFNTSLGDVQRIEVLRGPQGTLFGKNSTGGVLNIVTREPSLADTEARVTARAGNFGLVDINGYASMPLSASAALKVSAYTNERDGFMSDRLTGKDDYNDQNSQGVRAQLFAELGHDWELKVGIDWSDDDNIGDKYDVASGALAAVDGDGSDYKIASDAENFNRREDMGGLIRVTGPIGGADFTSITAYRSSEFNIANDLDFTELSFIYSTRDEEATQFSQELRVAGKISDDVDYIAGFYYEKQTNESTSAGFLGRDVLPFFEQPRDLAFFGGAFSPDLEGALVDADLDRESYALFASVTAELAERWTLQFGGRLTQDEQELNNFEQTVDGSVVAPALNPPVPPVSDTQDETAFSGDASLTYAIAGNANAYFRLARGFKGGGYNIVTVSSFADVEQIAYDPEFVTAYELGLKGRSGNGQFSGSAAVFYYDFKDKQEQVFNGIDFVGLNAQAEVFGFEAEARWSPLAELSLFGGIGYADATYTDFESCATLTDLLGAVIGTVDCSDNTLIAAPEWTGFVGLDAEKSVGGGFTLVMRIDASYRDSTFFGPTNAPEEESESFWLLGGRFGLTPENERWGIYIWGENLLDDDSVGSAFPIDFLGTNYQQLMPPRTYGIELSLTY